MSAAAALETRYRRLLALYPAEHRRKHQDEMLGVLMTGARTGQRWPGPRDAADLIWGALLIRLRPPRDDARRGWADALAVTSVVVPIAVLAYVVTLNLTLLPALPGRTALPVLESFGVRGAAWVIVTGLVLLRRRRLAGVAAAGMAVWLSAAGFGVAGWTYADPSAMNLFVPFALEAAALLASPGPRRGMQLMSWRRYGAALAIPAGLAAVPSRVWLGHPAVSDTLVISACVAALAAMVLASPLGKRVAALLALPVYYLITEFLVLPSVTGNAYESTSGWAGPLRMTVTFLPVGVLACVLLAAALRQVRRTPA